MDGWDGYTKLGYAIVEQAVEDLKSLKEAKVVRGRHVVEPWPTVGKGKKKRNLSVCGYSKPHEAKALVRWFCDGSFERTLSLLNATIDPVAGLQRLGFPEQKAGLLKRN